MSEGPRRPAKPGRRDTSWQHSSGWYDKSVGVEGQYYHQAIILPGTLKLLRLGEAAIPELLDLCCGQGVLSRTLPAQVAYWGVDLSPALIAAAKKHDARPTRQYSIGDVCGELPFAKTGFTHAASVLALQNVEKPDRLIANAGARLAPGGRFVMVLNHPCFRIPRQTSWGVDLPAQIRYRRVDRYLSTMRTELRTHPSEGAKSPVTVTFHHPLSAWFAWLAKAGLAVETLEEWVSDKRSVGPAAVMENRARAEFPLFMAVAAVKPRA